MTEALHAPQPSELVEHFLAEAISNSPQPLKDLAEFLSNALSEDDWKTADRLLLALAIRTQAPDSWRPTRGQVINAICNSSPFGPDYKHSDLLRMSDAILALRPQTAESGK